MPRFTFLGDDSEGIIQTPINLRDPPQGHINVFGRKVTIPDDGVKSVIVRSTNNWIRQIMIVSNQNHRICDIDSGVDQGTIQRLDLQEDEEIVGFFGTVDNSHDLKSFGVILYSP